MLCIELHNFVKSSNKYNTAIRIPRKCNGHNLTTNLPTTRISWLKMADCYPCVLRRLVAYLDKEEAYLDKDHVFSQEDLAVLTPNDTKWWM